MLRKLTAALAALTALIHIFVGGADALSPLLKSGLSLPAEGAIHACWHMVSFMLAWSAFVFLKGGKPAFHFGVLWIVSALIFIGVGINQSSFEGLIINPQWTILGLTGGLVLWSTFDRTASV